MQQSTKLCHKEMEIPSKSSLQMDDHSDIEFNAACTSRKEAHGYVPLRFAGFSGDR